MPKFFTVCRHCMIATRRIHGVDAVHAALVYIVSYVQELDVVVGKYYFCKSDVKSFLSIK